jgi:hypothetical protein
MGSMLAVIIEWVHFSGCTVSPIKNKSCMNVTSLWKHDIVHDNVMYFSRIVFIGTESIYC